MERLVEASLWEGKKNISIWLNCKVDGLFIGKEKLDEIEEDTVELFF